jgi:hypothetical protein
MAVGCLIALPACLGDRAQFGRRRRLDLDGYQVARLGPSRSTSDRGIVTM